MTYPAPSSGRAPSRLRLDAAQYWAGAAATAVVAALIALVGILICRWALNIPIIAPAGEGAWGNANTAVYVFLSLLVAIVAAGVLYLLVIGTSQPTTFFHWIMGLATLAAVVYPFSSGAPLKQKIATALVDLVLGIAITSLLNAVAARAIRRAVPGARAAYPAEQPYQADRPYAAGQQQPHVSDEPYVVDQPYPGEQGYVPRQQHNEPTVPVDVPRNRTQRRRP
jgi:hypothetical protein